MPDDAGDARFQARKRGPRGRSARRLSSLAAIIFLAACWEYDKGEGTFEVTISGGLDGTIEGHAEAAHSNEFAGLGYYVELDLSKAARPLGKLTRLVFWTAARPSRGGRFPVSDKLAATKNGVSNVDVGTSDSIVTWTTDSGLVDFKEATRKHGAAADFRVFASCPRCGLGEMTSHIVMNGSFQVQ